MLINKMQTGSGIGFDAQPSGLGLAEKIGRGVLTAGALAAVLLTAAPAPAYARNPGVGAAIGLGILGGVLAGAAIAAAAPPVYAAPPSYYYYPQQGHYYTPTPSYYNAPQPYYGPAAYSYPPYNYPSYNYR